MGRRVSERETEKGGGEWKDKGEGYKGVGEKKGIQRSRYN